MTIPRKPLLDFSGKRFLIIDDFADMRSMLRNMVESYGVSEVDGAGNGKDALTAMAKKDYDVILCDYNLGEEKDGQQILEEARHRNLLRYSTVFMMITAENTLHMVMGAVEYQPDDYMSKPFNKHVLRQRLEKIMLRKSDFEEIERAIRQGRLTQAIQLCDGKIHGKPHNVSEFLKCKAELYEKMEQFAEAQAVYEAVLDGRDVPWARMGLGRIAYRTGRYETAREIFADIIGQNANNMEAHDWLARCLVRLEEDDAAVEVLLTATRLSPKAIQRQMALGDLALEKGRYEIAERAFKKAVQIGAHSVFKSPANYTKQARAMVHTGSKKDALRVLGKLRKDFPRDEQADFQATLCEHGVLLEMGREEEARKAFARAAGQFDRMGGQLPAELILEMAQAYIANGDKDKGTELVSDLVKNHHEDETLLERIQHSLAQVGMEEEGKRLISDSRGKVVKLNNQGVRYAQEGRLGEAISLFQEALEDMPDNKTINSNTAMVLIMHMEQHGRREDYLRLARKCLETVKARCTPQAELFRLQERLSRLTKSHAA